MEMVDGGSGHMSHRELKQVVVWRMDLKEAI